MKHIEKNQSPVEFEAWKTQATVFLGRALGYDDIDPEVKQVLKYALLVEQGSICCYCMADINQTNSHIEHFIPRSKHTEYTEDIQLEYSNLLASCNGEHEGRDRCGHYKDRNFSQLLLSPTDPDVESQFTYSIDGHIVGITGKAVETINILNLDSFSLVRHRRTAIFTSGFYDEDFESRRAVLTEFYKERDEYGAFVPFCTTIVYIMEHY